MKHSYTLVTLTIIILAAGCGGSGEAPTVPKAQPAAASDIDIGGHVVHYSAQTTDLLSPQVARTYGIVRSKNRAMLTISVLEKDSGSSVEAAFKVRTVNLAGQLKNVTMRRVPEQEAIYYIGETGITNRETLIFNISVTPEGVSEATDISFTREFYSN